MESVENTPYRLMALLTNKWFDEWVEQHKEELEAAKKKATFAPTRGGMKWG